MTKSLIKEKSYSFALEIIGLYKTLLKQNEFVLSKQLLRAGTSIGANVEEALAGQSRADFLSYMDVDLSTDLKYFTPLIKSLKAGYDIAIGNRLMNKSTVKDRPVKREILSRGYNILIRLFFRVSFTDAQCGFKAVSRKVVDKLIPHIQDNAWFFDSELLIVGEKVGYRIFQQPVHWTDNPGSTVRVLKTVYGDMQGLLQLFRSRPWRTIKI